MPEVKGVSGLSGAQASVDDTSGMTLAGTGSHLGQVFIELLPIESRVRESKTVTADIRDRIGPVPQAERLVFTEIQGGPAGRAITIEVASEDDTRRQAAVDALKAVLAGVDGVVDIGDDDPGERRELRVEAKSSAVTLGLSESSIGQQVRTGLLGSVAHRFALDGEEVDLRVPWTTGPVAPPPRWSSRGLSPPRACPSHWLKWPPCVKPQPPRQFARRPSKNHLCGGRLSP